MSTVMVWWRGRRRAAARHRARALYCAASVVAVMIASPGAALAAGPVTTSKADPSAHERHIPATAKGPVSSEIARALGNTAAPAVGGGFNVSLSNGRTLHTHGPDTRESLAGGSMALNSGTSQRDPFCVADPATDYHQRVLYAYVNGQTNAASTQIPTIRTIFKQINYLLNQAALESSGNVSTADYKVACDGGAIDVGVFSTSSISFSGVTNAAIAAGFDNPRVDYSIFLDAPATTYCGTADFYDDDSPGVNNYNNNPNGFGSSYAVTMGGPRASGTSNCWPTTTPMHENGHNQGAAQSSAPHSTGAGHCTDGRDVMCYADGGPKSSAYVTTTCSVQKFDCGYDDYFDAATVSGQYLSTHWNIGSTVNRFIHLVSDAQVRVRSDVWVNENVGNAAVVVERVGDTTTAFDVDFETTPGSASAGDFTDTDRTAALTNHLHFNAGETSKTISVPIVNDTLTEPNELVALVLSNVQNQTAAVTLGTVPKRIIIRASDQKPDGYIKYAGGLYRGSNVYTSNGAGQAVLSSAYRGQTRTIYFTIQNDGNVRNGFVVRVRNSSGTYFTVNGSSAMTKSLGSSAGRNLYLDPGSHQNFRVDFKLGSYASGKEQLSVITYWYGSDRTVKEVVNAFLNVR